MHDRLILPSELKTCLYNLSSFLMNNYGPRYHGYKLDLSYANLVIVFLLTLEHYKYIFF